MKSLVGSGFSVSVASLVLGSALIGCGGGGAKYYDAAEPSSESSDLMLPQPTGGMALGQAASPGAPPPAMEPEGDFDGADDDFDVEERPGLATQWGETRFSKISSAPFKRADADSPFVTAAVHYNDESGVLSMSNQSDFRPHHNDMFSVAGGTLSIGLRGGDGRFLPTFDSATKNYIVGDAGTRYAIVVRNHSRHRFEVVLSVDGLDVLDGKQASFKKRGYLIDPHGELEIDGFRQSMETVAAFRFGSVESSYAEQKHGDSRNVGVIGMAVFHERGDNPLLNPAEIERRNAANPFPAQFATPPN